MSILKSQKRDVNSAQRAHFRTGRLRKNPIEKPKGGDKIAAAIVKCATVGLRITGR